MCSAPMPGSSTKRDNCRKPTSSCARPSRFSGGNTKEDYVYYAARMAYDGGRKDEAEKELDALLKSERPFMMRPEAKELKNKLDTETGS